ncbi:GGDEF domain-containing protein [Thalassotalea eurytherma]|uniref:diguanylate cyclase n=1 Tax=Thalassotalea eurytherma TaxID=1144278 RepID=A0ABQ6H892_9GAMM|nr:diguanylate cyclase [Thalassotalea eurytherma]GLX82982.1 hypothetical protein theurythT_24340 [Thalassotalea eurytherma]
MAFFSKWIETSKLSLSILYRILMFSGLFTLVLTSVQLYIDYQKRLNQTLADAELVLESTRNSLTRAVYELNREQTNDIVSGLMKLPYYDSIKVLDSERGVVTYQENQTRKIARIETLTLIFNFSGQEIIVGSIEYGISTHQADSAIAENIYIVLLSQFIKTFFASLFIMYIIHRLVTRHIYDIANWLNTFKPEDSFTPLESLVAHDDKNEMLRLKAAINSMGKKVHEQTTSLESLVAKRTEALIQANTKLEALAFTDSLTGISNRAAFFNSASEELERSRRLNYEVGLMMIDVDHFKAINDNFGHDIGDEILQIIAKSMQGCLRKQDTLARIGGEEFSIITPGADKQGMHNLADRLQQAIANNDYSMLGKHKRVTVSIGYTKISADETMKTALKRADQHLYTAKANGRNQFVTDKELVYKLVNS